MKKLRDQLRTQVLTAVNPKTAKVFLDEDATTGPFIEVREPSAAVTQQTNKVIQKDGEIDGVLYLATQCAFVPRFVSRDENVPLAEDADPFGDKNARYMPGESQERLFDSADTNVLRNLPISEFRLVTRAGNQALEFAEAKKKTSTQTQESEAS